MFRGSVRSNFSPETTSIGASERSMSLYVKPGSRPDINDKSSALIIIATVILYKALPYTSAYDTGRDGRRCQWHQLGGKKTEGMKAPQKGMSL